jgi:hypothetical protein
VYGVDARPANWHGDNLVDHGRIDSVDGTT